MALAALSLTPPLYRGRVDGVRVVVHVVLLVLVFDDIIIPFLAVRPSAVRRRSVFCHLALVLRPTVLEPDFDLEEEKM